MAAFLEERLRMSLLKVTGTNLRAGNVRCDGDDGNAAAVAIKEPIYQVQIAGAATSSAHREFTCQLSLCACGERRDFLVPDGNPLDLVADAQRLRDAVERSSWLRSTHGSADDLS